MLKLWQKRLMEIKELIKKAEESFKLSYSPYSSQRVGAAVLTESGEVFSAANIEVSSYSLTICAERLAIFNAVLASQKPMLVAVVAEGKDTFPPCGACLQVMSEFAPEVKVAFYYQNELKILELKELLSFPFKFKKDGS